MIQIKNIHLSFHDQIIFDDLSCIINQNDRIGLVGRNGAGKSTLLKVLAGHIELDSGAVALIGNKKLAYMPQDITLASTKTVVDEAVTTHLSLEPEDLPFIQAQAKKILMDLGFSTQQLTLRVDQLSTGWKMRLVLAKLLLEEADFYLFDEPTNHLDIFAQDWFLQFLKNAKFGFLLVCHEKAFLNKVCTKIYELSRGTGTLYQGNYTSYSTQKDSAHQLAATKFEQQQKEIAQKKQTIDRFRAKASKAKMAQSMLKSLDKIELLEAPEQDEKIVAINFGPIEQSGRAVLRLNNVAVCFGDRQLFKQVGFRIERGSRVALVAANGVGKSSLFRTITGELKGEGDILFGEKVTYAFFKQDQNAALDPHKTIWEEVSAHSPQHKTDADIRAFLGAFLFRGDDIYKKIGVLSGGEKNRVSMAITLLKKSNFLLLDEPTNHLDIQSKEVLVQALNNYPGTILFVSHDHDFVNRLATHVIELTPTGSYLYTGNFDDFITQKHALSSNHQALGSKKLSEGPSESIKQQKNSFESQKKLKSLEAKIEKREEELRAQREKLGLAAYNSPSYTATRAAISTLEQELAELYTAWESEL